MNFRHFALAALIAAAPLTGVSAQDYSRSALNDSAATALNAYGAQTAVIDDPKVPGGKAFRVTVAGKGAHDWDAALSSPVKQPVKAGDELVFAFWARLVSGDGGATSTTLPWNSVGLANSPWTAVFGGPATIGPEWKLHEVRGRADKDYPAGALNAAIQLATGKQVIDFGPVYVAKVSGGSATAAPPVPVAPRKPGGLASIDPAKIAGMVINDPGNPSVNKAKARLINDDRVTGGKALRIQVAEKGKNVWDSNLTSAIKKPIKAGDRLLLVFWARLEKGENGATTATLPSNGANLLSPPWTGLLGQSVDIGPDWKQFEISGTASRAYAPGEAGVSIQLATAKQTVDFGPVILLDLGQ
ncbi:MAG: hypothetical protein ABIQ32_10725 [Sphingomicrobium sp.]